MNKLIIIFCVFLMLVSFQKPNQIKTYSLTVSVDQLRNSKGFLQFALYNKKGSIPDEKFEKYYQIKVSEIKDRSATITFSNLPEGYYAISILHDENENGKIDKKFLLPIPKEGIGFSNFKSISLKNKPDFLKASFHLNENKTKKIKIIYL